MTNLETKCGNCFDYDNKNKVCLIRYIVHKYKTRTPMKRKPNQKACKAFMYKQEL